MVSILRSSGAKVEVYNGEMLVNANGVGSVEPWSEEIEKIRGGFFVIRGGGGFARWVILGLAQLIYTLGGCVPSAPSLS